MLLHHVNPRGVAVLSLKEPIHDGFSFSVIYFQTGTGPELIKQMKNKLCALSIIRHENSEILRILN